MSSLIPERPLIISPSLATTIGLEEAVLLQILNDVTAFGTTTVNKQNYQWHAITYVELIGFLPFWNKTDLQRIIDSLQGKGIILLETIQSGSTESISFAMNEQTKEKSVKNTICTTPTNSSQTRRPVDNHQLRTQHGATLIDKNWHPEEDLIQLMALNHKIPRDFVLQQLEDFVLYWIDRHEVSHSWSSKFRQHVLKEWRFHQSRESQLKTLSTRQVDINNSWQPSPEALEILHRTGVTPDFIEDAIPEFVLYWGERGEASSTWNSKFIAHIRRQWAKYTKSLELDYEPRQIPANWQPSEDVYDILRLANIDITFARQLIPEFVLFWRDTQEIQRSWNTKFLQHIKYQWATRHHMEKHYAGRSIPDQSGTGSDQSPFKQLTDRSWAEGIVEGL